MSQGNGTYPELSCFVAQSKALDWWRLKTWASGIGPGLKRSCAPVNVFLTCSTVGESKDSKNIRTIFDKRHHVIWPASGF